MFDRPPRHVTVLAALTGVGCIAGKVAIGDTDTFPGRFASELLEIVGSAAIVAAGLNEFARWWVDRYWIARAQPIVETYAQLALSLLYEIGSTCVAIGARVDALSGPDKPVLVGPPRPSAWPDEDDLSDLYRLPLTKATWDRQYESLRRFVFMHVDTPDTEAVRRELAAALGEHAEPIGAAAAECTRLLDAVARVRPGHAPALEKQSVDLRRLAFQVGRDAKVGAEIKSEMALQTLSTLTLVTKGAVKALDETVAELARVTENDGFYLVLPAQAFTHDDGIEEDGNEPAYAG